MNHRGVWLLAFALAWLAVAFAGIDNPEVSKGAMCVVGFLAGGSLALAIHAFMLSTTGDSDRG